LLWASAKGHVEVVKSLIEKGANVNIKNENGTTALNMALSEKKVETADILRAHGAILDSRTVKVISAEMIEAAKFGFLDRIKLFLAAGLDVDTKDKTGATALMVACHSGELEMVKFLLERGANVNAKNTRGITALMLSSDMTDIEMMQFLLEKGADVNAKTTRGYTALRRASDLHNVEVVNFLKDYGAKE
jgi:ankyrin repeat protein